MHIPAGFYPDWLMMLGNIIAIPVILLAIWRTETRFWSGWSEGLQIAAIFVALSALYMLQADIKPGMAVHWLGVMLTVMMVGPWTAIVVLSAIHVFLLLALNIGDTSTLGFNITTSVLLPVAIASAVHLFFYHKLPRIVPVYFAKVGVGDLLCMLSVDAVLTLCLLTWSGYPSFYIYQDFTLILALMGGMEAVISTWIVAGLVCYFPIWLVTFNDEEYINGK
ncbi:MAG: energy-coupling factor ABC transporter permease [Ghiorsea sp.]|nr:energy-coupling factor ABC transporter permease [Ghiorsea sp.]